MISHRALEFLTALLTGAFGLAVAISSLDNGISWSSDGVEAGTFPFVVGVIIVVGSLYNLMRGGFAGASIIVSRSNLRKGAALFLPAAAFVGLIPWIGFYLASAGYMLGVLALPKHLTLLRSVLIAIATPMFLYVMFERLFQVTLPHGALAAALGY
ncbi:MAG: tripartite tricarboxylate transporter TctB family protein [Bradyrhizobium sp.]|nr:tripartite tricarboxylate transporter TctB family protein [Bradyrhizobium sp.]